MKITITRNDDCLFWHDVRFDKEKSFSIYKIKLDGIEPIFHKYKESQNGRMKYTGTHAMFYPIRHLKFKIMLQLEYWVLQLSGYDPKECECCGEGIARWFIDKPNESDEKDKYFACDGCVNFYDWKYTRREYKIEKYRKQVKRQNG